MVARQLLDFILLPFNYRYVLFDSSITFIDGLQPRQRSWFHEANFRRQCARYLWDSSVQSLEGIKKTFGMGYPFPDIIQYSKILYFLLFYPKGWPREAFNIDSTLTLSERWSYRNPYCNKNAFQLKIHLPLANRKSNTYNLTLEWPWPWYDLELVYDLDIGQVRLS